MGDVINLNRYRKDKQAAERERRANEKRVRFGIPKSERNKNAAERALETRRLDGLGARIAPPSATTERARPRAPAADRAAAMRRRCGADARGQPR